MSRFSEQKDQINWSKYLGGWVLMRVSMNLNSKDPRPIGSMKKRNTEQSGSARGYLRAPQSESSKQLSKHGHTWITCIFQVTAARPHRTRSTINCSLEDPPQRL